MAVVTWKDLCIDVVDPELMGPFWAGALGLELHVRERDQMRYLTGPTPQHQVWLNPVPEPVTVKQRVHLDVHTASVGDLLALGATPLDTDSFRWAVLRDPEGGELCGFEPRDQRSPVPAYRLYEIGIDCAHPLETAVWWAGVLGGELHEDQEDGAAYGWVDGVAGMPFESMDFVPVPEPRTVKNRIHWDVLTDDVALLVARGATVLREPDTDVDWTVLADPEGNEFCAFVPDEMTTRVRV